MQSNGRGGREKVDVDGARGEEDANAFLDPRFWRISRLFLRCRTLQQQQEMQSMILISSRATETKIHLPTPSLVASLILDLLLSSFPLVDLVHGIEFGSGLTVAVSESIREGKVLRREGRKEEREEERRARRIQVSDELRRRETRGREGDREGRVRVE